MPPRRYLVIGLAAVTVILLTVVLVAIFGGGPEHHLDGRGPLGSLDDPRSSIADGFDATRGGPTWTVGLQLCLAQGNQPATLDGSVTPTKTVGNDFRYLGALVREFTPSQGGRPMISVTGFPPAVPETLHPVKGFVVRYRCQPGPNPDRSVPYTELLIGFGRGPSTSGGGWMGVDVGYTAGGHHHVVSIGYDILICGSAAPARFCGSLAPSPSASP
jgi:hypothetical protein